MKLDNILILGSTYLTELVVEKIKYKYNLIGYVPSLNPTRKGNINLPEVSINTDCDIKLSIQYDKIVKDTANSFNLHTGLLPNYGGTNILDYTVKNKEVEQGLTFHKMTKYLDYGPIISKVTYPVLIKDDAYNLYKRILQIGPSFAESCLELLKNMTMEEIDQCCKIKPTLYRRGEFIVDKRIKN